MPQLDRSADFTSKGLHPSLPDRPTPSSPLRRLASPARYPSPLRSLPLPARFACPHPTTRREHPASRPALRHSRRVVSPPSDIHPCPPTGCCRPRRTTPRPACPRPGRHRCGLRPSPPSASRPAPVSASRRTPPPSPPAACSARLPSAPSAVTATQSPWRLLPTGLAGVDSPSLIPWVLSFLTACRGFGSHTPRIPDAGCAIRTLGPRLSAQPPPSAAAILLDQAHVAPIHAGHHTPNRAGLRLSYTDTRAVHACRCRKHGPIHDRHTPIIIASTPVTAIVSSPCTPESRSLRRHPGPGIRERAPYCACP